MTELKPCPFCGSGQIHVMFGVRNERGMVCICGQCGIRQTSSGKTEAEAITAWNMRAPPATQAGDALVEELAKAVCCEGEPCHAYSGNKCGALEHWSNEARAILPIIQRREAAAHAAGRAEERAAIAEWLPPVWFASDYNHRECKRAIERGHDGSKEPKP